MSYINGSDILLKIGTKCPGHSTGHSTNYTSNTTDHAVKAPAEVKTLGVGRFSSPSVTSQSITISISQLDFHEEAELGKAELLRMWHAGEPVEVEAFRRDQQTKPYLKGKFLITSVKEEAQANSDCSFDVELTNYGAPEEFYPEEA